MIWLICLTSYEFLMGYAKPKFDLFLNIWLQTEPGLPCCVASFFLTTIFLFANNRLFVHCYVLPLNKGTNPKKLYIFMYSYLMVIIFKLIYWTHWWAPIRCYHPNYGLKVMQTGLFSFDLATNLEERKSLNLQTGMCFSGEDVAHWCTFLLL